MIKVEELKIGTLLMHSHRGPVKFTAACAQLMKTHGDPTSCFVDDFGETIEVSLGCLSKGITPAPGGLNVVKHPSGTVEVSEGRPLLAMHKKLITPEPGRIYIVKHSSGLVRARFISACERGFKRSMTRYIFTNLATGRQIILKSRAKIRREVSEN
jgi:hypothetical protein